MDGGGELIGDLARWELTEDEAKTARLALHLAATSRNISLENAAKFKRLAKKLGGSPTSRLI